MDFAPWVKELIERQATVHKRQPCPRCGAAVGERCHRAGQHPSPATLKHSHRERLRADGIFDR